MKLLLFFSHSLPDFRLAELDAVATLFSIPLTYDRDAYDTQTPFLTVEVETEGQARQLGSRCVLIRHIIHYWAEGPTYEDLHASLLVQPHLWAPYQVGKTFRVSVIASHHTVALPRVRAMAEGLSFMALKGKVDLQHPQLEIVLCEQHTRDATKKELKDFRRTLKRVFVGRKICEGRRDLVDHFALNKRAYVGNTSMESEVSLVMANMALASPGQLVYDPFAGTGSMLLTAAYWGAYVVGSDLDGRHLRGRRGDRASAKGSEETSMLDTAQQYGVLSKLFGCLVFDLTLAPWRRGALFDAIICDPPYGVRAGAKRIGRKKGLRPEPITYGDGLLMHEMTDYLPPLEPWPMVEVLDTLLITARELLKPGGRLVYFLPTVTEEYCDEDVPSLPGMTLVANSPQQFNKWTRRLITMERTHESIDSLLPPKNEHGKREPAHANFSRKYFTGFDSTKLQTNGSS